MQARSLAASVVLLLALSVPAWSQTTGQSAAGTDLAEANPVEWLKTHLGGAACVVYEVGPSPQRLERVSENTEVQFDGCRMRLQQSSEMGAFGELRTFTVPLATLDANAVASTEGFSLPDGWMTRGDIPTHTIRLTVPAGQPLIEQRVERFDDTPVRTVQTASVEILIRHEENARQIVRALTLAIEACQKATH